MESHPLPTAILSFTEWSSPWKFEEFVLSKLQMAEEKQKFAAIWNAALKYENWNYSDLEIGISKTTELLTTKFLIVTEVANQIARAAAYQWK